MSKHIHISTASTIHGVEIASNIGFISSHVVAGTNIISDIFGAFSDIFGGRSNSYKKQLSSIKQEAIEELKSECRRIGGNGIVGLSIDLDEVSGGGKTMFMITASGTAVQIRESSQIEQILVNEALPEEISTEDINNAIYKARIIQMARNKNLEILRYEVLDKIIEHKIFEISNFLLDTENTGGRFSDDYLISFKNFFYNMPREDASTALYSAIKNHAEISQVTHLTHHEIRQIILELLDDLRLFDYERIGSFLQSEQLLVRKAGLHVAMLKKSSYCKDDIEHHLKLLNEIEHSFKPISEIYEIKKFFSTENVWKCLCEREVDENNSHCGHCGLDRYGFNESELSPAKVSIHLKNNITGMKMAFGL